MFCFQSRFCLILVVFFSRSKPELRGQLAKMLGETIADLEKTSVSTEAPAPVVSVPSVPEDAIARLGRGFQTFKANHFLYVLPTMICFILVIYIRTRMIPSCSKFTHREMD